MIQTRRSCVVLHLFFSSSSSLLPPLPSFPPATRRVADYFFHRRDWESPFPFPTGSSRQVHCDPAWPFWAPEGASILPARRAGIRVPPFCSSPVCRTSSPLRLSPSSTDSTHSARKRGWTEEWAVLRGGGPLSVLRGPPPAPAGRLDLGARRQGLAPEAGRRSNTTQLRRLCYKLLSNTTEGGRGGRCVVLDRQIIRLGGALCLSPARSSPLGFSAPPGFPTGSKCPAQMSSSLISTLGGLASSTTGSFRSPLVGRGNENR